MSGKRGSDNSLERELDYEDITIDTGKRSKERRDESKAEVARRQEEDKKVQSKQVMLNAGKSSREKRKPQTAPQ
jgi:hypothetical protein